MKVIYPLLSLLSAAVVAAGPLPQHATLPARSNVDVPSQLLARTDDVFEPGPAPAPR